MNQGNMIPPITVFVGENSFKIIGPYAVAKIFSALNHTVLSSIWLKLKVHHPPKWACECLKNVDSLTEKVMQSTLLLMQHEKYCIGVDSNLPSIIVKMERKTKNGTEKFCIKSIKDDDF
jgi:hypothetical protein